MNLRKAKEICNFQGVVMHVEVPVICPKCNRKSLILDIQKDKGNCLYCKKEYKSLEEVLTISRETWLDKHGKTVSKMTERKSVKL
ncbi:MAG: hypothetical protein ACOCRO_11180 [Halanaerobiales bacterium]